ncbi:MAG: hypothetical protein GYB40_04095 [Vibrionaceae bacterium]|nr:hypothetical protein [Vibrionaceae bacterium]
MYEQVEKTHEKKRQFSARTVSQRQSSSKPTFQFVDNRPEAVQMRKLQELDKNTQAKQKVQLQVITNNFSAQHQPIRGKNNYKDQGVLQRYFDTSGYTWARKMWTDAEDYAKHLDNRLDLRVSRGDSYIDDLKNNLELKARKAGGTLAGEAYETFQWDQPQGTSIVYGPGGSSGGDLMAYESLKRGARARTPTTAGEVKSASSIETYKDGVANAYRQRGQNYIVMYATDESIVPDLHEFVRSGVNYAISDRHLPNGTYMGKTYTCVAKIELPDQYRYQYLYTWV